MQIWDFRQCRTERVLAGHGGDVKSCDWHPSKALVASGSKDAQVKLWDVKAGKSISTLMGHHGTVSQVVWNKNGNWLLTASRDQSLKVRRLVAVLQRVPDVAVMMPASPLSVKRAEGGHAERRQGVLSINCREDKCSTCTGVGISWQLPARTMAACLLLALPAL